MGGEFERQRNLLKSLLVLSSAHRGYTLPTLNSFILSEVANGVIGYLGGNAGEVVARDYDEVMFVDKIDAELRKNMDSRGKGKLTPDLEQTIRKLCGAQTRGGGHYEEVSIHCDLYNIFKSPYGICDVTNRSTFRLSHSVVSQVEQDILPRMVEKDRVDVQGIASRMREQLDLDLRYISENFRW